MIARRWIIAAIAVGGVTCLAGLSLTPTVFVQAWLVADQTAMGLSLGATVILLIHSLTGGRWGEAIGPQLRRIAAALPLALIAFLPLLGAIELLMPFLGAPHEDLPAVVVRKLGYLASGWLIARALAGAAVFMLVAWLAGAWRPPQRLPRKTAATIGLILYALALTLFSTDWMMALEPEFTSTIYAMLVASSQVLGALALATALHLLAAGLQPEAGGADKATLSGDLAKLLLSGILTWVYLAYMQWLIIWMGNLPDEIGWYLRRDAGIWPWIFWVMALLFAVGPFLALLLRTVRNQSRRVAIVALMLVAGYVAETIWRLGGAFKGDALLCLEILAALLLIGGVSWLLPGLRHGVMRQHHA